jgi:hypothetical protein
VYLSSMFAADDSAAKKVGSDVIDLLSLGVLGLSLGGSTGLPTFCKLKTDTDPTHNRIHQNIANLLLPTI